MTEATGYYYICSDQVYSIARGCVSTEFVAEYYIRKQFLLKEIVFLHNKLIKDNK